VRSESSSNDKSAILQQILSDEDGQTVHAYLKHAELDESDDEIAENVIR
jgi:hypothetical protein